MRWLALVGLGIAGAAACAHGTGDSESGYEARAGGDTSAGSGGFGGSSSSSSSSSSANASGTGGATSSASGTGGAGGMPPMCSYVSPNQCADATSLGTIAGDKGGPPVMVSGQTSQWLKIKVEEQVSSIIAEDMSYTATLSWPASMAYDIYIQEGPKGGGPDCGAAPIQGLINGSSSSVHRKWNDEQGFGGKDDTRWLCIEVRYVLGNDCGAAAQWNLTIQGHT
jgi:hypothetical protein